MNEKEQDKKLRQMFRRYFFLKKQAEAELIKIERYLDEKENIPDC